MLQRNGCLNNLLLLEPNVLSELKIIMQKIKLQEERPEKFFNLTSINRNLIELSFG